MNEENEKYAELLELCAKKIKGSKDILQPDEIELIEQLSASVIGKNNRTEQQPKGKTHYSPGESALRKQLSRFENTKFGKVSPERRPTAESIEKMGPGLQSSIDANSHPIEWNPDVLDY